MGKRKFRQARKRWFRSMKYMMRGIYRRPSFVFLGEKPSHQSIILSNHEGSYAPVLLEMYAEFPIRIWGTYEMNSGIKKLYKYQTEIYYHQKKHWNLHLARMACLIISPLTYLFYKGMRLISTYRDMRFRRTLTESVSAVKEDNDNIVIFPENSDTGYHKRLKSFYAGCIVFAQQLLQKGIDAPIYVSYYIKKKRKYVFDAPILFSKLKAKFAEKKEEMINYLLNRCNALGDYGEQPA